MVTAGSSLDLLNAVSRSPAAQKVPTKELRAAAAALAATPDCSHWLF
jgi:hypothetical protein